jgi:hypothetical protein
MLCEWCFLVGLLWESGVVVQVFMQQQLAGLLAHPNKQARAEEEEEEEEETESIYGDNDPKLLLLILLSSSSSLQFLALLRGPNPRSPVVSMSSSVTRLSSSPPSSSPDAGEFANSTTISTSTLEHFRLLFFFSIWRERVREREIIPTSVVSVLFHAGRFLGQCDFVHCFLRVDFYCSCRKLFVIPRFLL